MELRFWDSGSSVGPKYFTCILWGDWPTPALTGGKLWANSYIWCSAISYTHLTDAWTYNSTTHIPSCYYTLLQDPKVRDASVASVSQLHAQVRHIRSFVKIGVLVQNTEIDTRRSWWRHDPNYFLLRKSCRLNVLLRPVWSQMRSCDGHIQTVLLMVKGPAADATDAPQP